MKKITQSEFLNKCKIIHGNKFDYTNTVYVNCRTKIKFICKKHGEISMRPDNHIRQKQGCFNCFLDKHRLTKLSTDRVDNLKRIHNNKYVYNNLSVDKGFINILCPTHGEFKQYLYFHEYGHGCSQCNSSSRGEDYIKNYLENNSICYIRNHIFDGCKNKKGLRFDFYLQDLGTIIEYDGEHHFKENKYFGIGNLEYVRKNDDIKNRFCKENNIKIIRIPYYDYDKIDGILSNVKPSKESSI